MNEFEIKEITENIDGGNTGQLYKAKIEYEAKTINCLAKLVNAVYSKESIVAHNLMAEVNSENLMKVYGNKICDNKTYIFMEDLCDFYGLYPYLNCNETKIDCSLVVNIANCLGRAIEVMHQNKIKHGDIHLGNMMFNPTDNTFKLIDFDMVKKDCDLKCDCKQYVQAIAHVLIFYMKKEEQQRPSLGSYQKDFSNDLNEQQKEIIRECQSNIEKVIDNSMVDFSLKMMRPIECIIKEFIDTIDKNKSLYK